MVLGVRARIVILSNFCRISSLGKRLNRAFPALVEYRPERSPTRVYTEKPVLLMSMLSKQSEGKAPGFFIPKEIAVIAEGLNNAKEGRFIDIECLVQLRKAHGTCVGNRLQHQKGTVNRLKRIFSNRHGSQFLSQWFVF